MRRAFVLTAVASAAIAAYAGSRAGVARAPHAKRARGPVFLEQDAPLVLNGVDKLNGFFGDLGRNTLTSTALQNNPAVIEILETNPKVIQYTVQCALAEGQTVTVDDGMESHTYEGAVGLAPEWADAPCDEACQEWVTACLLARTNRYTIPVRIYITGTHPALQTGDAPDPSYSADEGAFYGNFFTDPTRVYTCRGEGDDPLYLSMRVCTLPGNRCGYSALGACGAIDGDTGLPTRRHACEAKEGDDIRRRCHNRLSIEGSDAFPEPNRVYDRVITIRVRKSTFGGGVGAPCVPPPPDGGVTDPLDSGIPPLDGGTAAGLHCMSDEDCASNLLVCGVGGPQWICTATCTDTPSQPAEQAECGSPAATCVGIGGPGICVRACTAGRNPNAGGCPHGLICTGYWIARENGSDRSGCITFCESNEDCHYDTICNPRTGACGEPVDLTKTPDGEPCTAGDQCRGQCVATSSTGGQVGVCASFVNLARTRTCPDDPQHIIPAFPRGDDLGICIFKACTADTDCTPPMHCRIAATGDLACLAP